MIQKEIIYFGKKYILYCDANCKKAWGISNRPKNQLSNDEDDYEYLSDDELGKAPVDPGTYEGEFGKPCLKSERLNKWCARECERSDMVEIDKIDSIKLIDFSKRIKNINEVGK